VLRSFSIRATLSPPKARQLVARVEASCDCLTILLPAKRVPPHERLLVKMQLDLSAAREYLGELLMTARGWTDEGALAFDVAVQAEVRPRAEFEGLPEVIPTREVDSLPPGPVPMPTRENAAEGGDKRDSFALQ